MRFGSTPIKADISSPLDEVSGAIEIIDYAHHEQHEGVHYFVKTWVDITGAGTVTYFMFRTPSVSTTRIHAKAKIVCEAEFRVEIYEDATVSADGTPIPGRNNDRDSTNTPLLQPFAGPTVTTDGTQIWDSITGSGRSDTGVAPEFGYEIIAKTNSVYLFKLTKVATGTHYVDVDFWWYEKTSS